MSSYALGHRRTKRSDATKQQIISAAAETLGRLGYEGTSLDAVAAHAGVTKGTVYYHFDSKETVYEAVLLSYMAETAERLAEAVQTSASAVEALDRIIDIAASEALDPKRRYIYYSEIVNVDPTIRETVHEAGRRYYELVSDVLARGQAAGELIPGNPKILSQLLLGSIGRASIWYNPAGEVSPAAVVRLMKTVILGGFLSERGRELAAGAGRSGGAQSRITSPAASATRLNGRSRLAAASPQRSGRPPGSPR